MYKIAFPLANDALSHSVQSWKAKYKHFIDLCKNPPYVKQLTEVAYYKRTEGGFLMMRKLEDHKLFKSSYLIQGIDSRTHGEVEKVQRWDELNIFYLSMREGSDQNQSLNGSSDRGQLRKAIQTLNIESEDLKDFRGCMDATVLAIKPSDSSKIAIWDRTTKQRMGEIVLENLLEPSRFELSEGLLMGYSSDFIYDFEGYSMEIWDLASLKSIFYLNLTGINNEIVKAVTDGKRLAVFTFNQLQVYDLTTRQLFYQQDLQKGDFSYLVPLPSAIVHFEGNQVTYFDPSQKTLYLWMFPLLPS